MYMGRFAVGSLTPVFFVAVALAQVQPPLPKLDDKPSPQVDAGGPSAAVTALAFSADGETLYAAGLDKVMRVWTLQKGIFVPKATYRVPIGPGNLGAINAVALSPDGAWVAFAGRAPIRGEAGFRQGGFIVSSTVLSPEQSEDAGVIYVANTANPAGGKVLRGHRGEVRALAFAPAMKGKPPLLVSAATERDQDKVFGGIRLWDVAAGKLLAKRNDLPGKKVRPGLALWHTGPGEKQIRVAVAWREKDSGDQDYLRLWDASQSTESLQGWVADKLTQTVALLNQEAGATLLTGGLGPKAGQLSVWQISAGSPAKADIDVNKVAFAPQGNVHFLPVSLAVTPTSGAPSRAAIVLQPSSKTEEFRLAVVDLRAGTITNQMPLEGSDKEQQPVIAASSRHVAVAATSDHAIHVYGLADLTKPKKQPVSQKLSGNGLALQNIAFVDKGRGLSLGTDSGGLLFDFDKRVWRTDKGTTIVPDVPDAGDWSLIIGKDLHSITVLQGKKEFPPLHVKEPERVTAAKLRPPTKDRPGMLAVATKDFEANDTVILLCDPADGKPYRRLIGHLQDVRDLAFSASRPLLASVGDDQTVCVWSLADIDNAVGEVPGLRVSNEDKKVIVRDVEAASAAVKTKLAKGDVLEKVAAPGGEPKAIKSAGSFLMAVAARKPGDEVEVTIADKGVVKLTVERGADSRKPLFSLFLLQTGGLPDWLGWSPAGPYDCSAATKDRPPADETHLGWHTNTGDPAAPIAFASAREYRKDYYREGILRYLAEEADLGRALKRWDADHPATLPEPVLWPVRPDEAQPTDRLNEFLVRQGPKELRFGINDDYALDDKHILRVRLSRQDGKNVSGTAAEISADAVRDGRDWKLDLSTVSWQRGEYQVRVGLHARAGGPELASQTATLRFQPPAPVVTLNLNTNAQTTEQAPLLVKEEKLPLTMNIAAPKGQKVKLQLAHAVNGSVQDAPKLPDQAGSDALKQDIRLREGLNRLMVRAVNEGAMPGHEDEEADSSEVWVSYKAPRELPPRFTRLQLNTEPELKRINGKDVWVVSSTDTISLTGTIEAAGEIVRVEWAIDGGQPKTLPLAKTAKQSLNFDIDLTWSLKAGKEMHVRLAAKSKNSDEYATDRWIVYHPPLPEVTIDPQSLGNQDRLEEKCVLAGKVNSLANEPFDLRFVVTSLSGKKSFKPTVDHNSGEWKAELSLFPGQNTIQAVVANEWRGEREAAAALKLRYRRPPRITEFPKMVQAVETNKVKVSLTVGGPADRPLVGVKVDQKPVQFDLGKSVREKETGRALWTVVLPEVFVNDGIRNLDKVSVQAVTDEGESQPVVVAVVHQQFPRPPLARFFVPSGPADTARKPDYSISFRVESDKPLERVEVVRDGEVLYRADLKDVEKEGKRHILNAEASVKLKPGPNALEVVAVNSDGRSPRAEVVVSYIEPPVLVSLDRVEVRSADGGVQQVLQPRDLNGDISFPQAPNSLVWLVGRVRWSDPNAKALDDPRLEVVVKVGDCRQLPVALDPRGKGAEANSRPFRVPLVLISSLNHIKVEVPSVSQQELSSRKFELACAAPAKDQRLHLLIVGVDVKDAAGLKKRVLDALAVGPGAKDRPDGFQGEFRRKPPFEKCILYRVLAGEVDRGMVEAQIQLINKEIRRLSQGKESGPLNDVVLIYYQGEDVSVPERNERWLKVSRNFQFPNIPLQYDAIPCHKLPRVPGAQFLLLNVAGGRGAQVAGADWGGDPDAGLMRYACDASEARKADPALLTYMRDAVQKEARLGDVVRLVNNALGQQVGRQQPVVILDQDQESRQISQPKR
jgi:WD40 repeat protein